MKATFMLLLGYDFISNNIKNMKVDAFTLLLFDKQESNGTSNEITSLIIRDFFKFFI